MTRHVAISVLGLGLLLAVTLLPAQQNMNAPKMAPAGSAPAMQPAHDRLVEDIFTRVEAADAALVNNDVTTARQQLGEAKGMIAQWRVKHQATSMASGKLSNTKCPIMLMPVGDHTPPELTRQFKGSTVGFCCPNCLTIWDKLSDADKLAKLKAVGWTPPAENAE